MHAKHADKNRLNELSGNVIGCAFTVLNTLGAGFLEKVYENALAHELRKAGFAVAQQRGVTVMYDGTVVGEYFVDLMIEDMLLVELKTVKALDERTCPGADPGVVPNASTISRQPACSSACC